MANVKSGNLTAPLERWKHLDWMKRPFWKAERQAHARAIEAEANAAMASRAIDRRPRLDDFGDTVWPDSERPQ